MGIQESTKYLAEDTILENIDEEKVAVKITTNRTIVNKKALQSDEKRSNEMSQGTSTMFFFIASNELLL